MSVPLSVIAQQPILEPASATLRPIIAELIANPKFYVGKKIEIYGLVIKVRDRDSVFFLQDVSQKPLAVRKPQGLAVKKGDQVLIKGTLHMESTDHLIFVAKSIVPEIVLGGCCE